MLFKKVFEYGNIKGNFCARKSKEKNIVNANALNSESSLRHYKGRPSNYYLDFHAQKFPLNFFNVNLFYHQQALHFGVLNYEKQHKEGPVKFQEDLLYFQHFMLIFVFAPN